MASLLFAPPRFVAGAGQDKTLRTATQGVKIISETEGVFEVTPVDDKTTIVIDNPTDLVTLSINARQMKAGDTLTIIAIGEIGFNVSGNVVGFSSGACSAIGNIYNLVCTGSAYAGGATLVVVSQFVD